MAVLRIGVVVRFVGVECAGGTGQQVRDTHARSKSEAVYILDRVLGPEK